VRDFVLIAEGPTYRVAAWRNTTICVMRSEVTVAGLEATVRAHRHVLKKHPDGVFSFTLGERGIGIPDTSVQSEAAKITRAVKPTLRGSVAVVQDEGFWVSAVRSVITAVMLLVPGWKVSFETDLPKSLVALRKLANETVEWEKAFAEALTETRRFRGEPEQSTAEP
jgi:hypothetical protein